MLGSVFGLPLFMETEVILHSFLSWRTSWVSLSQWAILDALFIQDSTICVACHPQPFSISHEYILGPKHFLQSSLSRSASTPFEQIPRRVEL